MAAVVVVVVVLVAARKVFVLLPRRVVPLVPREHPHAATDVDGGGHAEILRRARGRVRDRDDDGPGKAAGHLEIQRPDLEGRGGEGGRGRRGVGVLLSRVEKTAAAAAFQPPCRRPLRLLQMCVAPIAIAIAIACDIVVKVNGAAVFGRQQERSERQRNAKP